MACMKRYILLFLAAQLIGQETLELPRMVVSPTTAEIRPDVPVFGDRASYIETPRAYSTIDSDVLALSNVSKIGYFQSFDSSTQTIGTYGHTATVNVRGDMAELYQNGQRRTNNAAGFQPSLNGVERVDIVKGAAPVVFGPGFYSGGYVNMTTKVAESSRLSYGVTLGTLSVDHDYLSLTGFYDQTFKVDNDLSYRVSYEGKDDKTFYEAARDDKQDLYFTARRKYKDSTLDLIFQHVWQASPQVEGINNPSQSLISNPPPPTANLISPGDFSNANVSTAQAIYASPNFRSYSLLEYVNKRRFNAFAYLEWAKQLTFDQRVEWHLESDTSYTIWGAQARYEYRESYTNYFNAFFGAYDITRPGVRDASKLPEYVYGHPGPSGYLFFGPLDGNTDTTLSKLVQFAPFAQQRLKFGTWQILYGARADGYKVSVTDPLSRSVSDKISALSFSRMASLIKTSDNLSVYITYGNLYSVNGTVSGGGIVFGPDLKINPSNLKSLNRLYEVGLRYDNGYRVGITGFWQERQQPDLYAYKPNDIVVRGIELEASRGFGSVYVRSSVTYNEGNYVNSLPFEFAPTVTKAGDYRIMGLSRLYSTTNVTWYGKRWIIGLSGRIQSSQSGNALQTYHIPSQYTLDGVVSYHRRTWDATINLTNLTNRFNWLHNGDAFGDNAVIHHEPMRSVTFTIRFYR